MSRCHACAGMTVPNAWGCCECGRTVKSPLFDDIATAKLRIKGLEKMLCDSEQALAMVTAERDTLLANCGRYSSAHADVTVALATERAAHEALKAEHKRWTEALESDDLRTTRTALTAVTAERDNLFKQAVTYASDLKSERVAHGGTQLALKWEQQNHERTLTALKSTRTSLATVEAQVKELEPVLTAARAVSHLLDQGEMADSLLEALQNAVDVADGEDDSDG